MPQDSQQVLGDEIGRILAESGVTPEQAKYLRTGFVEMIQKNTMVLDCTVNFPAPNPVDDSARRHKAAVAGVTKIAQAILKHKIYKLEKTRDVCTEGAEYTVAVHIVRNAGI
jgi:phosphoribosyl-dephospho-CoA transferase